MYLNLYSNAERVRLKDLNYSKQAIALSANVNDRDDQICSSNIIAVKITHKPTKIPPQGVLFPNSEVQYIPKYILLLIGDV